MRGEQGAARVAVVAIGRNEGERFRRCLESIPAGTPVVYVDSGSTDGSVAFARERGVTVVELDTSIPFTAARARNAGLALVGDVEFVQMIDGDCALDPDWLERATTALDEDDRLAVVFGRRRERYPDASIYNRLCDDEWNVPVGVVDACGGDALFRREALLQVGGYAPELIAGEEPDMCLRLRRLGWQVRRIEGEMTLHDAAMTRFGQWWRRSERGGYAATNLWWRYRGAGDGYGNRHLKAEALWLVVVPLIAIAASLSLGWPGLLVLLAYPAQIVQIALRSRRQGRDVRTSLARGLFFTLGKLPEAVGALRFFGRTLLGRRATLIEYK
jgi:GT2 family glycosyltransferase